ncbi:MAG: phosphomannomutase/phosphoglucomutase [Candidatus Saccharibacteria bacterium]
MQDIKHIFKAYDVRGKVGDELNTNVVEAIGKAMADWLPDKGIVAVGRDMRPDSAELADAMIKGLIAQGRDVLDIGQVTSDMIYFAVGKYGLAGGAVITASHNPGAYNGIKLCREEARPIGLESGLDEVRDNCLAKKFKSNPKKGKITQQDITEDWIEHALGFIDTNKLKPLKIAVDAGNGMAGKIFPELEPYVPFVVTEMYFELDGTFPNHEANPLKFETLADMIKVIKEDKLDCGVAFDGDGDRAFLVDEKGEVLTGGVMSAMLSEYFLRIHGPSNIIYDARNSHSVPNVIKKAGGKPVRTRVGHALMKAAMRESKAPFGGEASGHFYFKDNWYADSGLIAAIIGLYILSGSGKKLSQLRKQYTHYSAIPETNFTVKDKDKILAQIEAEFKDASIDRLDGITLTFKDGWMNIRSSNTESLLRLNAEADNKDTLDKYVSKAKKIILRS